MNHMGKITKETKKSELSWIIIQLGNDQKRMEFDLEDRRIQAI